MCGSLKAHTAQLQFLRYIPDNCQPHQSSRETLCFNYQCCRISLFPTYPATPPSNHYVRRQILTQTALLIAPVYYIILCRRVFYDTLVSVRNSNNKCLSSIINLSNPGASQVAQVKNLLAIKETQV